MIPVEIITMLGSAALAGALKLWAMKMQATADSHKYMMAKAGLEQAGYDTARAVKNEPFQWTRRCIALMAVASIVVLPKLVPLFAPETSVYVGYLEEVKRGFWIFSSSTDMTLWEPMKGLVITPLDTHLVSAITGLYFGGSLVSK